MKTPEGKDCRFYYQNFHRGHSDQECRLILANPRSEDWEERDCAQCSVPDILRANSSPNLVLEGRIKKGFLGFNRRVEVKAFCSKHVIDVGQPESGCIECAREKPGLQELFGADLD